MIIDTSAVIAILEREAEADRFVDLISGTASTRISAVSLVEAGMVMRGRRSDGDVDVDAMMVDGAIEVVPVDLAQARVARAAFARYGKGNHPAALNLGDLFSYALAKHLGEPLLFKGNDFSRTDITPAIKA